RVEYAAQNPKRWQDEYDAAKGNPDPWPSTRGIVRLGYSMRALKTWLPLAAGITFLIALFSELKIPSSGSISLVGGELDMHQVCSVGPFREGDHNLWSNDKTTKVPPVKQVEKCREELVEFKRDHHIAFVTVIGQTDKRELQGSVRTR